jgi:choline dehydrogenase-like flavoprotein
MSESTVAIVGSGIVGASIANTLTSQGYDVEIFEKGPEYPYPHSKQFAEKILYLYENPTYELPKDLKDLTLSGDYRRNLNNERHMVVGGSATQWEAITLRMSPHDFKTRSLYGYGEDWPITYHDLEPYYCKAETLLAVSGTDADNAFAPPRSKPYPLPPFELSYDDVKLAKKLRNYGILLHTTPQARTRTSIDGRPGCMNFGECFVCPIGARYSPNYHLQRAVETGLCKVRPNVSVRRIILDQFGRAKALVYRLNDASTESEHAAKVIIVAAGAIESARLLFLSKDERHPDGPGNDGGHVGKHFMFHHVRWGTLHYKDPIYPRRVGAHTGQSCQFADPPKRGKHGGVQVEFLPDLVDEGDKANQWKTGLEVVEDLKQRLHWRLLGLQSESVASPQKYITLSEKLDRFGDPYAHVHYESTDFDHETDHFVHALFDRLTAATEADKAALDNAFDSAHHHMGGCRMGHDIQDSVVDQFGKIHGSSNLFVVGGSNFVSTSAVHPTLTMVALAIRTADHIMDQTL